MSKLRSEGPALNSRGLEAVGYPNNQISERQRCGTNAIYQGEVPALTGLNFIPRFGSAALRPAATKCRAFGAASNVYRPFRTTQFDIER